MKVSRMPCMECVKDTLHGMCQGYLAWRCVMATVPRLPYQGYCAKATVPRLPCQGYRVKATVSRLLCQGYCVKATVSRLLCQGYCAKATVPRLLSWLLYHDYRVKATVSRLLCQGYRAKATLQGDGEGALCSVLVGVARYVVDRIRPGGEAAARLLHSDTLGDTLQGTYT